MMRGTTSTGNCGSQQETVVLLTITLSRPPAGDLGFLLHKHPDRVQAFGLSFGQAHVFYPVVGAERCTAALLVDVDPVALVRGRRGAGGEGLLDQYVNDRPYAASSLLSVALADVFRSALAGRSPERPELVEETLPLEAKLAAIPCRGGEPVLRRLFEPLGYTVQAHGYPLDEQFPAWGASPYWTLTLRGRQRLQDLLRHLYVLIPVLDDDKHYWVGDDEVEKLLRHGEGWLAEHPERQLIADRYLKHRRRLVDAAVARLTEGEEADGDAAGVLPDVLMTATEPALSLHQQRLAAVFGVLKSSGARRVLDLGCGEGRLLQLLLADPAFTEIVGLDVSARDLEIAAERLHLDRLPVAQRERLHLLQGSLTYRDRRLAGYDAAAVVEVIEHLDPPRLAAFERVLFAHARPSVVVITTPNVEYNALFPGLPAGRLRHRDHRFEWTRAEFQAWAQRVGEWFDYTAAITPVGPEDPALGAPSQMAVLQRQESVVVSRDEVAELQFGASSGIVLYGDTSAGRTLCR
jgi:3' terminal RNA ribose 2'-O-methyltransferase Hen1